MRDARQLDLFDWKPPCQVVAFPHDRLLGRARRILELRAISTPGAMDYLWRWEVEELDMSLTATGLSMEERERQIDAFASLVRRMIRQAEDRQVGDAA